MQKQESNFEKGIKKASPQVLREAIDTLTPEQRQQAMANAAKLLKERRAKEQEKQQAQKQMQKNRANNKLNKNRAKSKAAKKQRRKNRK